VANLKNSYLEEDTTYVAIKKINKDAMLKKGGSFENVKKEIHIMRQLRDNDRFVKLL
jgi:hypothetical protein